MGFDAFPEEAAEVHFALEPFGVAKDSGEDSHMLHVWEYQPTFTIK